MDKPPCLGQPSDDSWTLVEWISFLCYFGSITISAALVLAQEIVGAGSAAVSAAAAGAASVGAAAVWIALIGPAPNCDPAEFEGCVAGIINAIDLADADEFTAFPWLSGHPNVELVCKSAYWPFLMRPDHEGKNKPEGVYCTRVPRPSPLILCYYHSKRICNAHTGAMVGGVAGGVAGLLIAMAVATAIGCVIFIFCLFALLLAAVIGAVTTLAGIFIGGQLGAQTGNPGIPEESKWGKDLRVGDYATLEGKFKTLASARIGWFVTRTSLHGRSSGTPPFSFSDANHLKDNEDDCSRSDGSGRVN